MYLRKGRDVLKEDFVLAQLADAFLSRVIFGVQLCILSLLPLLELLRLQLLHEAVHVDAHHVSTAEALKPEKPDVKPISSQTERC